MGIKRLTLVFSIIIVAIWVAWKFFNLITNFNDKKETTFINYVRRHAKRTRAYCSYPISKEYQWVDFANVRRITFSRLPKGIYRLKIETYAPIPTNTKGLLSFSAYFDTPSVEGLWDTGVIYANKNYPFSSNPPSPNGGVFRTFGPKPYYRPFWVGGIKASVNGSVLVIDFASALVDNSKKLEMVVVYYLPADIKLPRGWSIWSIVGCDIIRIDPSLEKSSIMVPPQP